MAVDYNELSEKQDQAVAEILHESAEGGALLAAELGTGKTRMALMVAAELNRPVVLAVVPLQTMESWVSTAAEFLPNHEVRIIENKKDGKAALADFQWNVPGFYIVGQEYWERQAWTKELKKKRRATEPDQYRKVDSGIWGGAGYTFIYDESHRAQNRDSWTFKALMNLHPDTFKVGLSGTPTGNSFGGAYGTSRWIWPHRTDIIPANYKKWMEMWAVTEYNPHAPGTPSVLGEQEPGAFVNSLPCYIKIESMEDPASMHEVWVDISPEQRRVYDELDDSMVAWVEDHPMVTEYPITKRIRQRQTTLAMPTLEFDEAGEVSGVTFSDDAESAKIDALIREIHGQGELGNLMVNEPLLILTDSQKFASLLTRRLNEDTAVTAAEWSGKVSRTKRKQLKQDFIDGEISYIVGVQAAMGTGTDGLQHRAHIGVFMSRSDNRIQNEQSIGRLNRTGQEHAVHWVSFLANDTIDTGQLSAQLQAALDARQYTKKRSAV